MNNPLFDLIKTENARQETLAFLESFSRGLFTQVTSDTNNKYSEALKQTLGADFDNLSISERDKNIKDLIAQIKTFPSVEVQVATTPTEAVLEKINQFVHKRTNTHSVLNIKIKPEILGGVILIIEGKYVDLSVAKRLNETFARKGDINSLIEVKGAKP